MRLFLLFFTLLSANTSAFYFEDNADDFLSLSLEELMHVQIKTGSLFSTTNLHRDCCYQ